MRVGRLAFAGAVLAAAACTERLAAPGQCPTFCPTGRLTLVDTLLPASVTKDSAYRGYVQAYQGSVMLGANLPGPPGVDSRPIFRFGNIGPRLLVSTDTSQGTIRSADSARLHFSITRRDTAERGQTLTLYRLPITIDTTTTFTTLDPSFRDSLVRRLALDSLLGQPGKRDSATGDTSWVDALGDSVVRDTLKRTFVSLALDSSQIRYIPGDTGKVAYGIRLSQDPRATLTFGTGGLGPTLQWYLVADSIGTLVKRKAPNLIGTTLTTFVFNPPAAPLDGTLAVGGVPSARSILRITLPRAIRDSVQFVRGTLLLVPAVPARGAPTDSFVVEAHTVYADFGAKSPLVIDATRTDTAQIRVGASDTVKIEIANLLQFWQSDTTRPATIVLRAKPEVANLAEIRFYPSDSVRYRPVVRLTYLLRFPFGTP
jgi:hypothetical protein